MSAFRAVQQCSPVPIWALNWIQIQLYLYKLCLMLLFCFGVLIKCARLKEVLQILVLGYWKREAVCRSFFSRAFLCYANCPMSLGGKCIKGRRADFKVYDVRKDKNLKSISIPSVALHRRFLAFYQRQIQKFLSVRTSTCKKEQFLKDRRDISEDYSNALYNLAALSIWGLLFTILPGTGIGSAASVWKRVPHKPGFWTIRDRMYLYRNCLGIVRATCPHTPMHYMVQVCPPGRGVSLLVGFRPHPTHTLDMHH